MHCILVAGIDENRSITIEEWLGAHPFTQEMLRIARKLFPLDDLAKRITCIGYGGGRYYHGGWIDSGLVPATSKRSTWWMRIEFSKKLDLLTVYAILGSGQPKGDDVETLRRNIQVALAESAAEEIRTVRLLVCRKSNNTVISEIKKLNVVEKHSITRTTLRKHDRTS